MLPGLKTGTICGVDRARQSRAAEGDWAADRGATPQPAAASSAASTAWWIGPCGWSYPDWEGVVYPRQSRRGVKPLQFLARFFNAVEVNSSFYALPSARVTAAWPRLTPPAFRFAFKLTRCFTHERGVFPDAATCAAFQDALRPLQQAGKLGPILMQFPWSFRFDPQAADWLRRLADAFGSFERFVEVRHSSWAQPAALKCLKSVGGACNIDQPALRDCLPPTAHAFGPVAYVRLHGRNSANWFAENQPAYERYNYLYSEPELREWVERLLSLEPRCQQVYVFTNNHFRGQAVANALELRAALTGERPTAPDCLLAAYPRLRRIATPQTPTLFD